MFAKVRVPGVTRPLGLEKDHHSLTITSYNMPVTISRSVAASETAESEQAVPIPIDWSTHHQSPEAEVVLVSSDNVSFKVDVWYLKQKRFVFPVRVGLSS